MVVRAGWRVHLWLRRPVVGACVVAGSVSDIHVVVGVRNRESESTVCAMTATKALDAGMHYRGCRMTPQVCTWQKMVKRLSPVVCKCVVWMG